MNMQRLLPSALISREIEVLFLSLLLTPMVPERDISLKLHLALPGGNW